MKRKRTDNLAGTWAEDTTRKFTEEKNITDNKNKNYNPSI